MRTARFAALLLCLIALTAHQQSALAQGTSEEPTIVFQAPGLYGGPVINRIDKHRINIESSRWNHFVSNDANAMVEHWDAWFNLINGMGNVKRIPIFYRFEEDPDEQTFYRLKGTHIEFVGEIAKADSVYGKIDYIRAKAPSNKNCFFFQRKHKEQKWKGPKEIIRGWYCSAVGQPLSDDAIHSAIGSLRVKGWKVPQ